mmetsp:Transcript_41855/g.53920  ORF Transcript_41855/g.53920 Transcript_41855/m.53920 type:complete len:140 (-) Transcript_41855:250-669(-)|eukprot:CAMPEP_0114340866 /NCGR_PEP_ID=MMETSP0101-20121206/8653_1 /TAXON_ID=38822 ORGANISM="Pteridomonas danica, Strain PT" /NCGR_SAMPLE_ID=MMETSP0101 /ASSEMBLY_ACC=CAM_ASM_000211 /LENGTH=139 /DNA_ID=CAMNT_0001474253 /DNA_START=1089 /DNA_END=1508 /DNA_ORIENTATION=+
MVLKYYSPKQTIENDFDSKEAQDDDEVHQNKLKKLYHIGIEVDGPRHYLEYPISSFNKPKGSTLMKHRQLKYQFDQMNSNHHHLHEYEEEKEEDRACWKFISIPYWKWRRLNPQGLESKASDQEKWLESLLENAVRTSD